MARSTVKKKPWIGVLSTACNLPRNDQNVALSGLKKNRRRQMNCYDMTLSVKVKLNPNAINQPINVVKQFGTMW